MYSEILPVSEEKKEIVVTNVKKHIIPALIGRDYPAEKSLKTLHRAGTWYSQPGTLEQNFLNETYIALYAGLFPLPRNPYVLIEHLNRIKKDKDRFKPYGYALKGCYRILGGFAPNTKISSIVEETSEEFTGAIPVRSKDYQKEESLFYYPPVFNIDRTMNLIGTNYDQASTNADSKELIATNVARFYFLGMAMVHPFIGGNHRGFDRFIEYAFAKKGIEVQLPQNNTLNIPNDDPVNTAIYTERRRLLASVDLEEQNFNLGTDEGIEGWLDYQNKLNQRLFNPSGLNNAKIEDIASTILKWT